VDAVDNFFWIFLGNRGTSEPRPRWVRVIV
jgi:hypothetical protein